MASQPQRPVYLDLRRIRLPVTALTSILHRISGLLLFLTIPFVLYLLDLSLSSARGYEHALTILDNGLVKLYLFVVIWGALHHVVAGIRFMLIDADVGVELEMARKTAKGVTVSVAVVAVLTGILWL